MPACSGGRHCQAERPKFVRRPLCAMQRSRTCNRPPVPSGCQLPPCQEPLESILFSMGFVSTVGALLGALVLPGMQTAAPPSPLSWAYLAATTALAFVVQVGWCGGFRRDVHLNVSANETW